ncbi:hypothetical protein CP532_2149 [Ophiocordyceps camponoti-leonardi (nom. inval.)]|nr:hypothetical protein CP532_2149 [Ophiocordyceps camponoti-leonardi (nom. inval.)]
MSRGVKRKRKHREAAGGAYVAPSTRLAPVQRDLLQQQFCTVQSLRAYLICKLPNSSRLRRKKIALLGVRNGCREAETKLARVLDSILICSPTLPRDTEDDGVYQEYLSFSQRTDDSNVSLSDGLHDASQVQADIVNFVVWRLFRKHQGTPNHILCDGFRRTKKEGDPAGADIHGIFSLHPNPQTVALKCYPWPNFLALLGQSGQRIMIDLLLHCSMFEAVEARHDTYLQLSGRDSSRPKPLVTVSDFAALPPLFLSGAPLSTVSTPNSIRGSPPPATRKPSDITLVRSRVFYSRPVLDAVGRFRPGFSPFRKLLLRFALAQIGLLTKALDVLNKCPCVSLPIRDGSSWNEMDACNELNTRKLMMHLFPRQFGLCNVFTPKASPAGRDQGPVDYATREAELAPLLRRDEATDRFLLPKVPKRLRGVVSRLVQQLQVLHARCSYTQTLEHYCPTHHVKSKTRPETSNEGTGHSRSRRTTTTTTTTTTNPKQQHQTPALSNQTSIVDAATPASHVSAFCQAVLSKMIPDQFWGDGDTGSHNRAAFLRKVDHFIKLRRFESMSLHEIFQGIKVADIAWLGPSSDDESGRRRRRRRTSKLSSSDTRKREEIFHEFLYFAFDSLLIPLIRGCFYVTESNTDFNQVFYFRHDVWRLMAAPAIARFRRTMFEEVDGAEASRILESRSLGCGRIRLLPKGGTFRLIMNLKGRNSKARSRVLPGPSINSVLRPVHCVLNFEKKANPSKLGSSLMSVGDIYTRLKHFKQALGQGHRRLYFVKVDVHAAFDTIPQEAMTKLTSRILSQRRYTIKKHTEVQPSQRQPPRRTRPSKPVRRWRSTALATDDDRSLRQRLTEEGGESPSRPHTIFVENVVPRTLEAETVQWLMREHVQRNLVRIGNKVFRQSRGIPQGSILSSFLCSYFYADLEMRHLAFLRGPDCLLMRLIDDFLLITLDRDKAVDFLRTMHRGLPDYGVTVSREKTLVNFDIAVDGVAVPRLPPGSGFPYCGLLVDEQSLDISKDTKRSDTVAISKSLTIDFGRSPGHNFQRKMLNAFARRSHPMLFDTSHNSKDVVLQSLREAFSDVSHRMWAYIRCLPRRQRPSSQLVIGTISKLVDVAFRTLSSRLRRLRYPQSELDIRRSHISDAARYAFLEALMRKQTGYGHVISWLQMRFPSMASLPKTG